MKYNKKIRQEKDNTQYFFVIKELTLREIKRKYARSYLGILWSVLNPLLTMIVMSLIFSTMFRHSIENFPIYYLTGNILWTLFSTATNSAMSALVDNRSLLQKAKLPKQTFVLARIYTTIINFGYTCIAYILMLLIFHIKPSITMMLFPIDIFFSLLFAIGIGYTLSIIYVFFADIKHLYSIVLTLWMYLSALFYPIASLPESMKRVVEMNPIYISIAIARDCMMYQTISEYMLWVKLVLWGIGSFLIGFFIFKKKENLVMQKI